MATSAVMSGTRAAARCGCGLLGLSSPLSTATTAQRISHYLAHHPRATWEALSVAFPAAATPHHHLDSVLLSLAKHPHPSTGSIAKNALTFFHWSSSASSSSHSLRAYCLLVHLLARAALLRDASVLLQSAITKNASLSTSSFLDDFYAAYENGGGATTTRGLHLLVHTYARMRLPEEALEACRYLAQRGVLPSLAAFNATLHAAQRAGRFGVAWEVFEFMTLKRVYADRSTIEAVVGVLSREGNLAKMTYFVERIHGKKCAPGVVAHVALALRVLDEEGRLDDGLLLLSRLLQRNLAPDYTIHALTVYAYSRIGDLKSACEQRDDMVRRGGRLNAFVYTCLVGAHCRGGDVDEAEHLLQEMLSMGLKPYDATYTHLITGCCRQGRVEQATEYFDKLLRACSVPDTATCNEMFGALCLAGEASKADELLTAAIDNGAVPNEQTYLRLIDGYDKIGDAQGIVKIYHEMEHRGLNNGDKVFASLINGLCRCGDLKEADKFLAVMEQKLPAPTSGMYDALVAGYCEKGNTKRALWLYDEMTRSKKLIPSADVFMMLVRRVIKAKTNLT